GSGMAGHPTGKASPPRAFKIAIIKGYGRATLDRLIGLVGTRGDCSGRLVRQGTRDRRAIEATDPGRTESRQKGEGRNQACPPEARASPRCLFAGSYRGGRKASGRVYRCHEIFLEVSPGFRTQGVETTRGFQGAGHFAPRKCALSARLRADRQLLRPCPPDECCAGIGPDAG